MNFIAVTQQAVSRKGEWENPTILRTFFMDAPFGVFSPLEPSIQFPLSSALPHRFLPPVHHAIRPSSNF